MKLAAPPIARLPESVMAPSAPNDAAPPVSTSARSIAPASWTEMSPASTVTPSESTVRRLSAPKVEPVSSRVIATPETPSVKKLVAPATLSVPESVMPPVAPKLAVPPTSAPARSSTPEA